MTANRAPMPKRGHKSMNVAKMLEEKREKELGLAQKEAEAKQQEETEEEREERERKERAEKAKRIATSGGMGMGMGGVMAMGGLAAAAAQKSTSSLCPAVTAHSSHCSFYDPSPGRNKKTGGSPTKKGNKGK